jgi:HD-like signal output (HDOD) protein
VGAAARRIAAAERAPTQLVDLALMAGLLHDVGRLILASQMQAQYAETIARARLHQQSLLDAERQELGTTHAAVGAYLLALWGLPDPMVEAVAYHHDPSVCAHRQFGPLTAVHVADVLADGNHGVENATVAKLDERYIQELGLGVRLEAWRQLVLVEAPAQGGA